MYVRMSGQGVRSMKKTGLDPLYVFIKPPSVEELVRYVIPTHENIQS